LEVEAADPSADVQHFADEVQARAPAGRHRRRIDLVEIHAAGGRLRVVVAAAAADVERPLDERVGEAAAIGSCQLRQRHRVVHAQVRQHRRGKRGGQRFCQRGAQRHPGASRRTRSPLRIHGVEGIFLTEAHRDPGLTVLEAGPQPVT
jgi:hypothetical protein